MSPVREPNAPKVGRGRYDFAAVADGDVWRFIQGQDFNCAPISMAHNARQWAKRNGYVAAVSVRGADVLVQFRHADTGSA